MNNSLARFPDAGSFIAGLLIGLSIVVPLYAVLVADPSDWQTLWVLGAPIILALGLTLQIVVTARPRQRRATSPELEASPAGFMELSHERSTNTSQRQCLARIA